MATSTRSLSANRLGILSAINLALLLVTATTANARRIECVQDLPAADKGLDLAVPDSPGFTVLGLDPQTVTRPTSPRELAGSLLSGVDANGNFQTGLALDTAPYMLLAGEDLTIGDYRNSSVVRTLARAQLSLATAKGANNDDDSLRIGLGLRTVLWDEGDLRTKDELWLCFDAILENRPRPSDLKYAQIAAAERALGKSELEAQEAALDAHDKDFQQYINAERPKAEDCRERIRKKYWNASGLELAAAPSMIQKLGGTNDNFLDFGGAAFWASLAYGFENVPGLADTSQLILHTRYRLAEQVPIQDAGGVYRKQDGVTAGLRLRLGQPSWNVSIEADYIRNDPQDGPVDDAYRATLGTDLQLRDDIWLNLGIGGTAAMQDDDRIFVLANVKWGSRSIDVMPVFNHLDRNPLCAQ